MRGFIISIRSILGVLSVVALAMVSSSPVWAAGHEDWIPNYDPAPGEQTQNFIFGASVPTSAFFGFATLGPADALPGGRDCCIRDDTVEVRIDGCLWGTIVSGPPGAFGTHPFTTVGPFSVAGGNHTVEYRNTVSSVGPSGWFLDTDPGSPAIAFSGNFACSAGIDIKPGSFPNSINRKSMGLVPVAILGSASLDVTTINVQSLRFGPSEETPEHDLTRADHQQDVNGDGFTDLVSHYRQKNTGIASGDTSACITFLAGGVATGACDSVRTLN